MIESKPLPQSDDCEKGLLCSLILNSTIRAQCFAVIPSDVFYNPANRIVFDAFKAIEDTPGRMDFYIIKKWITDTGRMEEIGGLESLSSLWDFVPSSSNWRHYLKIVKECWQKRNVINHIKKLDELMYDPQFEFEIGLSQYVERILTKLVLDIRQESKSFKEIMMETAEAIEARTQKLGVMGARFGIDLLDTEIEGFRDGEYTIICAETSGGKSALSLGLVLNEAKRGNAVGLFSLEMSGVQIVERLLSLQGRISMKRLRSGKLIESDFPRLASAQLAMVNLPIHIEEAYRMTVDEIVSRCRVLKIKNNIQLVIVDYLQLLGGSNQISREREIATISRKLRLLALELGIPVIALSQLNEEGHLRESRAIGHDADIILDIRDAEVENIFEKKLILMKNRNGMKGETINLNFFGEYMRFEEVKK